MRKLTLLLALVSLPAFADTILPGASPQVAQDTCLTHPDQVACSGGYTSVRDAQPAKEVSGNTVDMKLASFRGPRGIPDSMLNQTNPEFVNTIRSVPHREASVTVGVARF